MTSSIDLRSPHTHGDQHDAYTQTRMYITHRINRVNKNLLHGASMVKNSLPDLLITREKLNLEDYV